MGTSRILWVCALLACGCSSDDSAPGPGGSPNGSAGSAGGAGRAATGGAGASAGTTSTPDGGRGSTAGGRAGGGSGTGGRMNSSAGGGGRMSSAGAGGRMNSAGAGAGGEECPPECLRAYSCAASCAETPFNNGCCPCPAGTIDVITCPNGGTGGFCRVPCTGIPPDPEVEMACPTFTSESDCTAYESAEFPYNCEWHTTPSPEPCLAP